MNIDAAKAAHEALIKSGVNFIACLPDSAFQELYLPVSNDPKITYVQVASENDGVGVCMRDLGVATAVHALLGNRRKHTVSRLQSARGRRSLDLAGDLRSRHEWQVRFHLVGATDLEEVEEVHRRRPDTDPDEVIAWRSWLDVFEAEFVWGSQLTNNPRFWHRAGS